ncbi:MAG: PPOX class F420-dependent oxidoreductase [Myxococcales bacterium]|nr:PPOX class F420-dependent oxidoreductase [Myxococcales bacterium]
MTQALNTLTGEKYINVETFKRDGSGVKTPVWFAIDGETLVFLTNRNSWKVKRLRRNPAVRFAVCDVRGKVRGEWFDGECSLLVERSEEKRAEARLKSHYRVAWPLFKLGAWVGRRIKDHVYYRITPTQ